MRRLRAFGMLAILMSVFSATAPADNAGDIFSIGLSVRSLGMAGAYMALADDEAAVLHNPCGLAAYDAFGFTSVYSQQFGGVSYGGIGIAIPYVGAALLALDSGVIASGDTTFRYATQGAVVSLAVPVGPVALGLRFRYAHISSPSVAGGWALDPAISVETGFLKATLIYEAAIQDPMRSESGSEDAWLSSLGLGVAATLEPFDRVTWSATFQADRVFSSSTGVAAGLETWIGGLGARVGYSAGGLALGLSVRLAGFQLDWAYAMHDDLGDSHRAALSIRF